MGSMEYESLEEIAGADRIDSRDLLETMDTWNEEGDRDGDVAALEAWRGETEGYGDSWDDGVFFIADREFEDYAQELAEDIGAIPRDAEWPARCIDWEQAARELQMDYTETTFMGRDFWYR